MRFTPENQASGSLPYAWFSGNFSAFRRRATWNALMRQLDRINSLAHLRHTQQTEGQEAVSIAKHLLDKLGTYPELGGNTP